MNQPKPRHELKHIINQPEAMALRQRLSAVMAHDSHAGPDGAYRVRSLYFDNYEDRALQEKLDGISCREKFRLRYYGEDMTLIKLERKTKQHGLCRKYAATITADDCRRLLTGDAGWLLDRPEPVCRELYVRMKDQLLRPRTLVAYTREAYVFLPRNVRVTLDTQIRSGLNSTDFLNPEVPTLEAGPAGLTILEIKYDEFLPDIIGDIVQVQNRQAMAVSKYATCRITG